MSTNQRNMIAGVVVIVFLCIALVFGLTTGLGSLGFADNIGFFGKGSPAPDFVASDLAGRSVTMSEFHGRPVMINFWATWCTSCRVEKPFFQRIHEEFDGELVVLAINQCEAENITRQYIFENGYTMPVLLDPQCAVGKLYRVHSFPTTFFIDSEGIIQRIHVGSMDLRTLQRNLTLIGVGK